MHTYRITPLSLWNAASAGIDADSVIERLERWTKFPIPENIIFTIRDTISRYGKIRLVSTGDQNRLLLEVTEEMPDELPPSDPRGPHLGVYHWLTYVQDGLVQSRMALL